MENARTQGQQIKQPPLPQSGQRHKNGAQRKGIRSYYKRGPKFFRNNKPKRSQKKSSKILELSRINTYMEQPRRTGC